MLSSAMPNVVVPTCLSCSGVSIGQKKFCNTADLNGIMPSIRDGGCPTDQQIMDAVHNKVRPACMGWWLQLLLGGVWDVAIRSQSWYA